MLGEEDGEEVGVSRGRRRKVYSKQLRPTTRREASWQPPFSIPLTGLFCHRFVRDRESARARERERERWMDRCACVRTRVRVEGACDI